MGEDHAVALDANGPTRAAGEAAAVPEPQPLGPADVVPRFRGDLRVSRGSSAAFFDVSDPASGRTFTLYEFELAIARMLDGRRQVTQVIESGARLGIPIDLRSFDQFVRQMRQYGFLAPPGTPPEPAGAGGTWGAREPWDEETRSLFQSGQRLLRLGRNAEAAAYFEAVLDAHPANPEAQEMLALIRRGHSLAIGRTLDGASEAWPAPPSAAPIHHRPAVIAGAIVGVAVLALGAIALLVPPGAPGPVAPVGPDRGAAPAGASAPRDPAAAAPSAAARTFAVERRSHPPVAELPAPAEGELVWARPADAPVAKGERVGEVRAAGGESEEEAALARRVAELEALAAKDPVYGDFLEKARRERHEAAARRPPRVVPVVAPAAGLLAHGPQPAGHAAAGEQLARILDPTRWLLAAALDAAEPPPDAACEVVGDTAAERAPCRLVAPAQARAGRATELLAEVSAADAPWIGRAGTVWLRLTPAVARPPSSPRAPAAGDGERGGPAPP